TLAPDAFEQGRILGHCDLGAAELTMVTPFDLAAELLGHRLFAVADAEDRHTRRIDCGRSKRCVRIEHRGGPAEQVTALRPSPPEALACPLERHDFARDFLFTHPPRNELGDLGTKINDENLVVFGEPLGAAAGYAGGIEEGHCNLCAGATRPVKAMFCDRHQRMDAFGTRPTAPHRRTSTET